MRNYKRSGRRVPWYHVPKPRCVTLTVAKERCANSASWEAVDNPRLQVCKTHMDMMLDVQFKRIRAVSVDIRDPETGGSRVMRSVKFSG